MLRDFQSFWPTQTPGLYLVLVSFVFYLLGLILGRWLKRRVNVELGWTSHVFIVSASITLASRVIQVEFPGVAVMGLLAAITAAFPINAWLRRFVWPLCRYPGEKSQIPSGCRHRALRRCDVFRAGILLSRDNRGSLDGLRLDCHHRSRAAGRSWKHLCRLWSSGRQSV
jgi:hypothetical protein